MSEAARSSLSSSQGVAHSKQFPGAPRGVSNGPLDVDTERPCCFSNSPTWPNYVISQDLSAMGSSAPASQNFPNRAHMSTRFLPSLFPRLREVWNILKFQLKYRTLPVGPTASDFHGSRLRKQSLGSPLWPVSPHRRKQSTANLTSFIWFLCDSKALSSFKSHWIASKKQRKR